MSESEGKEPGFKVVDKRRHSADGQPLSAEGQTEKPKEKTIKKDAPEKPAPKENKSENNTSNTLEELSFASFFMSLAHQTLVLLGEAPHPETNLVSANMEASKQSIDILSLLAEKTKGNLTTDEESLVTEVLSSLRMAYVSKTTK